MNFKRVRKTLSIVAAGAALAFGMNSAYAGKIFLSGHDSDDGGHVTQAFGAQMLDLSAVAIPTVAVASSFWVATPGHLPPI